MANCLAALASSLSIASAILVFAGAAAAAPRVVTSIAPVQSLVAGVMEGIATPELIVRGAASPHSYALRPSEGRALSQAEIVFWIGPIYESFLVKPLKAIASKAQIVTLAEAPSIRTLPTREGGDWEGDHHRHAHKAGAEPADGHLFLDPENANAIVRQAAEILSQRDPANAGAYRANEVKVLARLDELDAELRTTLMPVRGKPFIVFHDAYQYFERHYDLNAVGAITVSPERPPSAQRIQRLRRKIVALKAVCVFSEPQFEPTLVQTVIEKTGAKTAVLDPLGADNPPGPDAYFKTMRDLAAALVGCLG